MPFFNACSWRERAFYEDWQRATGLSTYQMCQELQKQRDEDERRAYEDYLWEGEQVSKWEDEAYAAREAEDAAEQAAYEAELIAAETVGMTEEQRAAYMIEYEAAKIGAVAIRKAGLVTDTLTRFTELIERGEHRGYFEEDEMAEYAAKPMSDEELEAAAAAFLETDAEAQAALEQLYIDLYMGHGPFWAAAEQTRVADRLFASFARDMGSKILPKA
jgi:hypothetical protein